ncbi:MAG: VCBS repeat-containing protein [Phycisphaerae bacterium]|nr:VCBS repeat-containing protein [Phycisphaerae bacterium]
MKALPLFVLGVAFAATTTTSGQDVYHSTPDWVSTDTEVSTGAALVDLDRDGWLDLVVANGNDMAVQHLAVYYNQGDGTFPPMPDWQSTDTAYNGHLDVADVNGDGWADVAVAHLGNSSTFQPIARVYLNNGGTLSSLPDWTSDVDGNAFGIAFGDVNRDGRPDLAVGTGWAYTPQHAYPTYVYLNVGGSLEATASWESDDTYHYQGVLWVDADDDGRLDLVGAASRTTTRMYVNLGSALETTASWSTNIGNQDSIMATAGDVNGDGLRDLFLTDNTQLSGSGLFRQYDGLVGGLFSTTYSWSYYDGYGSAVALADVNADGLLDLSTGAWWDHARVFFNDGSGFGSSPDWSSGGTSVVEKIVFGDVDKNGLRPIVEMLTPDGSRQLFYLARQPIQEITSVQLDGGVLQPTDYTFSREHGWISVAAAPTYELRIAYTYSSKLDMAVSNWDNTEGNYLYYNQLVVPGDANCDGVLDELDIAPFVLLLIDRPAYDAQYPDCDADTFCDMDDNGTLNGGDIQEFVNSLLDAE